MKKFINSRFAFVITVIVLIFTIILVWAYTTIKADVKKWNDGVCIHCNNGSYTFIEAEGTPNGLRYVYQCDNCAHLEILHLSPNDLTE